MRSTEERPRARIRLVPMPVAGSPPDEEPELDSFHPRQRDGRYALRRGSDGVQGALALDFVLPSGVSAVPTPCPRLRLVGRDLVGSRANDQRSNDAAARRPDAARWAATIVQAVVEVVAGDRPLAQLARWTTAEVYEQLSWRRRSAGTRLTEPAGASRRSVISSVHVFQPADDVAEVCAITRRKGRAAAIALRLEAEDDTWRCTAISLR